MQTHILSFLSAAVVGLLLAGPIAAQPVNKAPQGAPATDPIDKVVRPLTDWLERANREYQESVVRELSVPTGKGTMLEEVKVGRSAGGSQPTLIDQVKGLLGIEPAKAPEPDAAAVADAVKRDEAVKRQVDARKLEQQRNAESERVAEQQRIAAEAKKVADIADLTTKQNQKSAEVARLAEEERRKAGIKTPATPKTAETDPAKTDEKAAAERKATAAAEKAAADRKAVAAVEKADAERKTVAAAEKAAADRKAVAAAAEKAAIDRKVAAAAEKADTDRKAVAAADKLTADNEIAKRKALAAAQDAQRQREIAALKDQEQKDQSAADAAKKAEQVASFTGKGTANSASKRDKAAAIRTAVQTSVPASSSEVKPKEKATKRVKVASRDAGVEKRHGKSGRCSRAGHDVDLPAIYVVKSGDTLWDISRRYYDKGIRFDKILRANSDKIESPDMIYPCQKFFLPGRTALYWVVPLDAPGAS